MIARASRPAVIDAGAAIGTEMAMHLGRRAGVAGVVLQFAADVHIPRAHDHREAEGAAGLALAFGAVAGIERQRQARDLVTHAAALTAARLRQFDAVRNFFAGASAVALLDLPFVAVFLLVMWAIAGPIVLVPLLMIVVYAVFAAFWLPGLNEQVAAAGAAKTVRQRRLMDTLTVPGAVLVDPSKPHRHDRRHP